MMAGQLPCDVCNAEPAAQMLTNVDNGTVMTLGLQCLPIFYHQSLLTLLDAGAHDKIPGKCQTCRRVHEQMITASVVADDTEPTPTTTEPPVPAGTE